MFQKVLLPAFALFGLAIASAETFPAANGLERSLVAREPLLKNPVSLSVDTDGTIYVTETVRRKVADLDIRQFVDFGWVERDVALTSIDEKRAFYRAQLNGVNEFPNTDLKDNNGDGKITIADLTTASEKVIRITDEDGDGTYESSNVFAEGFNTEVTGVAAGTLAWRGDVYATIAPDVWKLRDTTGDGKADKREVLAHGFGHHIAYGGHDMHGLTLGPDGRIYWTIGDKGTNVTSQEGKNFYAPHEGAVLRCYPDGSGFEIFARGLRNPQEIAFDRYGNMFSVDNDSDQPGERERFLHITEGSDTGWRCYYQYRSPSYNPWMAESISVPSGDYQPAYITPTNENYSDGPAGFAFNPGTALNERYRDSFFVTEFPKGDLRSFKVRPKGATFDMTGDHVVLSGVPNVGITFGPDGALYSADWGGGYPLNEKGAVWKLDDPTVAQSEMRKQVAQLLQDGPTETPTPELLKQLAHPDQRIRMDAQWELAARGAKDEFVSAAADLEADEMTVIHSIWGLSQMRAFDQSLFTSLINSDNSEFRAQGAKYASESQTGPVPALESLLNDPSSHVRFYAALSIWKLEMAGSIDAVIAMLDENGDRDAYLRHAGVLALTASSPEEIAAKTLTHVSPSLRLAAAIAFRRQSSPLAAKLLQDEDAAVVSEAARAIFDDPAITAAYPALADLISSNPSAQPPAIRRSIAANRYLADRDSAIRLSEFASRESAPEELRVAALEALVSWTEASQLNPVDGRHDPLEPADQSVAKESYTPFATALQHHPSESISTAAATVSKNLGIVASVEDLVRESRDPDRDAKVRIRSLVALASADPDLHRETLPALLQDGSPVIRAHVAAQLADSDAAAVTEYAARTIAGSGDISERQRAVATLGKMAAPEAKTLLADLAKRAQANPAQYAAILLEITEAVPASQPALAAAAPLHGGNLNLGRQVFNENIGAQCTACHRVGEEGSAVGPPLTEVGKHSREYILESLLEPQAVVTAGYGLMTIKTKNGGTLSGYFKEENDKSLTLILPDKTEKEVPLPDIESRTDPLSTMPPMGNILKTRELRDLVEYLSQQK